MTVIFLKMHMHGNNPNLERKKAHVHRFQLGRFYTVLIDIQNKTIFTFALLIAILPGVYVQGGSG